MLKDNMKVGDYVRINSGDIGIIINCPEQLKKDYSNWLWIETTYEQRPIRNEDIIKSSPNIIDLIEVGDYVNGDRIDSIETTDKGIKIIGHEAAYSDSNFYYWNDDIETIVTKEMYSSVEYRVENKKS